MKDFTAELEQVFGVAPSRETGLLIDTFDDTGIGGGVGRPTVCRAADTIGWTRVDAAFSICIAPFGDPSVSPSRVASSVCWAPDSIVWTRVSVPA